MDYSLKNWSVFVMFFPCVLEKSLKYSCGLSQDLDVNVTVCLS